jgi:hypothetical protein
LHVYYGLTLKSPDLESHSENKQSMITGTYYISNSEIMEKEKDYITYRFHLVSYQSLLLNTTLNYATNRTARS